MESTNTHFKSLFNNQILKDIKFYNISEKYLDFDPDHKWVIQGGIEFIVESGIICIGWNGEMQLFEMIEGDLDQMPGDTDIYEIDLDLHPEMEKIKNQKITSIVFNWSWYQKMDEDMVLTDEKTYIPQEIKIHFENECILQVATVLFKIKDKQLFNPVFDPQGNILVTLNQPVEIVET